MDGSGFLNSDGGGLEKVSSGDFGCAIRSKNLVLRVLGPDLGALWLNWERLE